jgi:hypothetical protein
MISAANASASEVRHEDPPRRRWPLVLAAGLALAIAAYAVWPLASALGFLDAARRGDVAAVAARVDFPALRRSVARQVVADQVRQRNLGALEATLARGAGTRAVAVWLEEVITAQAVVDLAQGRTPSGLAVAGAPLDIRPATTDGASSAVAVWWASGFTGLDGYRVVQRPGAGAEQGAIDMTLTAEGWKITGVALPQTLRTEIARRAQEIGARP